MNKQKLVSIAAVCIILAGCSSGANSFFSGNDKNTKKTSGAYEDNSSRISQDTPKNDTKGKAVDEKKAQSSPAPTPTPTPTPSHSPQNIPSQPVPKVAAGEKLKFDVIDKLDNTKYSWWLSLNNQHKTPGFPSQAKKFVEKHDGIYIGDTTRKIVYLTFDEGYENGYTSKILDVLKADNVKSIFFVTGPYIKEHPELVKRMLDEGHLVGNHTINHPSLPTVSDTALENELYGLEKQFSAQYGKGFKYMRPPMGEYSEKVLVAAQQLGYKTVFWSYAYKDYDVNDQKGADYAYKMVMNNLHNGAVYLLHAVSKDNAEALDRIIKDLRAEGYTISPFDL